jgi:heme exporter protein B
VRSWWALLRKELLLQWRTRAEIVAVFVFGAITLLLFSFAVGPSTVALRAFAAGFLWIGLLLASTLSLAESFQREVENRALEGLLLLSVSPSAIYYAKAAANWLLIAFTGVALLPEMIVLYDVSMPAPGKLLAVVVAGSAALAAPGTLYAAMTAQVRSRSTLMPLLVFPLVVPVLLAAVKATALALGADIMREWGIWIGVLLLFNAIHWPLGGLLFGHVVEE